MDDVRRCAADGCNNPAPVGASPGRYCVSCRHRKTRYGDPLIDKTLRIKTTTCAVEGCDKPRYGGDSMCGSHQARRQRYGDPLADRRRQRKAFYVHTSGYIVLHRPKHPLADKSGRVYEHRKVLFDRLGPGIHPCHWCGKLLGWDTLQGDHLDTDKANNALSNLVPSCRRCNIRRANVKTHCKRGHEFTPENTRITNKGHHWCRECGRARARARYRTRAPMRRTT